MAKILVTGASGRIGRYLVPALLGAGFAVRAQYVRQKGPAENAEWRQCDFTETLDFNSLVAGCDAIVHLAAEMADLNHMQRTNVDATRALAQIAGQQGVRYFAYASSIVVYGSPKDRWVTENTPLIDPQAELGRQYRAEPYMLGYARTKVLAEMALRQLEPQFSVDLVRPSIVVDDEALSGPPRWGMAKKFIMGNRRTQFIHVRDVTAAFVYLLQSRLGSNQSGIEAFNLCDEDCGTYANYFKRVARLTNSRSISPPVYSPWFLDVAKDMIKYRSLEKRYPLGLLHFSARKLANHGFVLPAGIPCALDRAQGTS